MAEWRNEISGHVTGPVVQAGSIDHVTVNVGAPEDQDVAPLTSWADRPELPRALRDLMTAQHQATESLPYKLLGVKQPELTQVYVQQNIRTHTVERGQDQQHKQAADTGERTLTVNEALNRSGHLMITGDPGSGKSTVGYMYVQQICDLWLSDRTGPAPVAEPVLPLRVPARALADNKAWAVLLAAGAEEMLGRLLVERPKPELFARRAMGARWLVFVDGLDEIVEPETRAQVIEAIAHQIRRSDDQRLVITTRPLPAGELAPLVRAGVETYALQPFSPVELVDFAKFWFRAQSPIDVTARAEEFVRQVRDGRLRDLVRNPLLATIAAIAKTLEPNRPLPNSRVDLYDRFMAYLLDDNPGRRHTMAELRRSLHDHPARLALLEWAHQHRVEIVEHLAVHRMETEAPLSEAAYDWVRARRDDLPESWQVDLQALLSSTGVFTATENDLRFRHHSFAEFLAARSRAGTIPADFPDLDGWIEKGLTGANQNFALFTFVLWGRENHDVGKVLTTLLARTKNEVLLAGRLLAEEVVVAPGLADAVVRRLVDAVLANGVCADPWDDVEEIGEVLGSFAPESLGAPTLSRLQELRDRPELAEATRIECAIVLGRLTEPEGAARWLERFCEHATLAAVKRSVMALPDLVPDGVERAGHVLVRMAERSGHDHLTTMAAVSLLLDIGSAERARRLVRGLCARLRADPRVQPGAELPLATDGLRIVDDWDEDPADWSVLADLAVRAGCPDDAVWAAELALAMPTTSPDEFADAITTIAKARGADAGLGAAAEGRSVRQLVAAAQALRHDHPRIATDFARLAVTRPHIDWLRFVTAARVFVSCGSSDELLQLIAGNEHLGAKHVAQLPRARFDVRSSPAARDLVRDALTDPAISPYEFWFAAEALLESGERGEAEAIHRIARGLGLRHRVQAAIALYEAGHPDLGDDLSARGHTDADTLIDTAVDLVDDMGPEVADGWLTAAIRTAPDSSSGRQANLAEALAQAGRADEARTVAHLSVVDSLDGEDVDGPVGTWLKLTGAAGADDVLTELLSRDVPARGRLAAANEFAEAGLLAPAVTLWLDVLRRHGAEVAHGLTAASRLVRCGHRDDALATLDTAITDERLPSAAKARLRALRAWVTA
ncbi:NACHT domain-containing protein [Actinophytocola sp. KF-1]